MCNVIQLLFSCDHLVKVRRSQCRETKHKDKPTNTRAACTAASLLTLNVQADCSSCLYTTWENDKTAELARAKAFLDELKKKCLPGVDEISALVEDLEVKYQAASWHMASHASKKLAKVPVTNHRTAASPLLQELHPEDVMGAECEKQWNEMEDRDYDGDYIASMDPMHPVSTDYSHPRDDDDGAWLSEDLLPEEHTTQNEDVLLDFDQPRWIWDTAEEVRNTAVVPEDDHNAIKPAYRDTNDGELMAWGTLAPTTKDEVQPDKTQLVQDFWNFVNPISNNSNSNSNTDTVNMIMDQEPHEQTLPLQILEPTPGSSPSTPPEQTPHWPDSPTEADRRILTSPSAPLTRPPPPTSLNSTRTNFDNQRRQLKEQLQRDRDQKKFHGGWLRVAREEVKAVEGLWLRDP